jgi:hypothetical protein
MNITTIYQMTCGYDIANHWKQKKLLLDTYKIVMDRLCIEGGVHGITWCIRGDCWAMIIGWFVKPYSPARCISYVWNSATRFKYAFMGLRSRDSCRTPFKHLRILPLQSQYILSLLIFVVENNSRIHVNSEMHSFNTRQN